MCTNDLYYITPTVKLSIYSPIFLVTWSLNKNKTAYHVSFEFLITHSISTYSASEPLLLSTTAGETQRFLREDHRISQRSLLTTQLLNGLLPTPNHTKTYPRLGHALLAFGNSTHQRNRSALCISKCSSLRWFLLAALLIILQCSSSNSLQ